MAKKTPQQVIKELQDAFNFEEKAILEAQYDCYSSLPNNLNAEELKTIRKILDTIMVQSLNHANIIGKLIMDYYERTSRKVK